MGKPITSRSDIYSLGIVMYEMITGSVPYTAGDAMEIMKAHCSPDIRPIPLSTFRPELKGLDQIQTIITKCLETGEELRYQTISELKADLEHWARSINVPLPGSQPRPLQIPAIQTKETYIEEQQMSICALVAYTQSQTHQKNKSLLQSAPDIIIKASHTTTKTEDSKNTSTRRMVVALAVFAVMSLALSAVLGISLITNSDSIGKSWVNSSQALSNFLQPPKKAEAPAKSLAKPPSVSTASSAKKSEPRKRTHQQAKPRLYEDIPPSGGGKARRL
jgi:Protein kinase domain.